MGMGDYLCIFVPMKKFLCGVNVYVFITMVPFLQLKITKNCQKWVYMGMDEIFLLETWRSCPKGLQNTLFNSNSIFPF